MKIDVFMYERSSAAVQCVFIGRLLNLYYVQKNVCNSMKYVRKNVSYGLYYVRKNVFKLRNILLYNNL